MPKHLLGIEGLTKDELYNYLNSAKSFIEISERDLKKVPALRGKSVVNLFLEASTRTRSSFELAAKRLSADTINLGSSDTSITKGETLLDTAKNLEAMAPDIIVIRHRESGAPHFLAKHLTHTAIINAGDGLHEHPTQALLDCLTLMQHFEKRQAGIENLKVAIVGDILHSRVARSNTWANLLLGNQVNLVGPPTLLPDEFNQKGFLDGRVKLHHNLAQGIEGADVIIVLRMQLERMSQFFVPNLEEYSREFCISKRILDKYAPGCVIMHPGPANRGTEITSEVLDSERSLVSTQVTLGVAVRMAVMFMLSTSGKREGLE